MTDKDERPYLTGATIVQDDREAGVDNPRLVLCLRRWFHCAAGRAYRLSAAVRRNRVDRDRHLMTSRPLVEQLIAEKSTGYRQTSSSMP